MSPPFRRAPGQVRQVPDVIVPLHRGVEPEPAPEPVWCPGSTVKAKVVRRSLLGPPTVRCVVCGAIEQTSERRFQHRRPARRKPVRRSAGERVESVAMGAGQTAVRRGGKRTASAGKRLLRRIK